MHPGGTHVLLECAGQDASEQFFSLHRSEVLKKYKRYMIGTIRGATKQYILPVDGELSLVPFAEPTWCVYNFSP